MDYLNFDVEISPKHGVFYPLRARSEAGEAGHEMRFPIDNDSLEYQLLRVEAALLRSMSLRRAAHLSPDQQLVQNFGQLLFVQVFTGEVRNLYERSRGLAAGHGQGVRIRFHIRAPELSVVPWEFLFDPHQGEYLCFLPATVLVRYLDLREPIPPFKTEPPLRVLVLVAEPGNQSPLAVNEEVKRLQQALKPLEDNGRVKLSLVSGQTFEDLEHWLLQRTWHIFHFIGHGGFDADHQQGVVALANQQGTTILLSATELGRKWSNIPPCV